QGRLTCDLPAQPRTTQNLCFSHCYLLIGFVLDTATCKCGSRLTGHTIYLALLLGEQSIEPLLVLVVVDALVQLHARLHGVDHVLLGAVAADGRVDVLGSLVHGAERRQRIAPGKRRPRPAPRWCIAAWRRIR